MPELHPTFDENALLKSVDDDLGLLREIVHLFSKTDAPRLIAMLQEGAEQKDLVKIYEAGHALKGLFGEMRAAQARSLAYEVELAGKAGNLVGLDSLVLGVIAETEQLQRELYDFLDHSSSSHA